MPHGESWITVLLGDLYDRMNEVFGKALGFGEEGLTALGHHVSLHHVLLSLLVLAILGVIGWRVSSTLENRENLIIPSDSPNVTNFIELIVDTTFRMMADMMGEKAARFFLPLIGSLALFILLSNMLGLIPGMVPPTSNLNTTLACALVVLVVTHYYGFRENGLAYFKHFLGPVWWLAPLLLPIELLTHFAIRPGTLAVRLGANMTADHSVLEAFLGFGTVSLSPMPVVIYLLGLLVVIVQTLVFCLLSTVYIAQAIEHEAH
jgi:F-type H+-transporting ATPase subunit a